MSITAAQLMTEISVKGAESAQQQISGVGKSVDDAGSSMHGLLGHMLNLGSHLGQTVIGLQGLQGVAQGFYGTFLKGNADMEQTTVAFETLLGKGKKTQDFLQQMKDFAAATPFEFPEVATAAQHMLAFGFQSKQVIPYLTNIGDAMGSMGKGGANIDHIVTVFGQMHAAGKLNAGDMNQIVSEGIPAWKFLADAMGKTVPEVQKLTSHGLIPADKAIQAVSDGMHKMFGGGMAAQANTFKGLLSTLQDNANAAMRAFTGPLFDAAKGGLVILGDLVSSKAFQDFATNTAKQIAAVFKEIGSIVSTHVVPAFQQFMGFIGQVKDAFQEVFTPIQKVQGVLAPLTDTFDRATGVIKPIKEALSPLTDTFDRASGVLKTTHTAIKPLLDTFDRAPGVLKATHTAINPLHDALVNIAKTVKSVVGPAVNGFLDMLHSPQFAEFTGKLQELAAQITGNVNPAFVDMKPNVDAFFSFITNIALPALSGLVGALATTVGWLKAHGEQVRLAAIIIGSIFVPAIIKAGIESAIAGAKIEIEFVSKIIMTGVEGLAAVGKLTVFIATMIATGVQAVLAGAKVVVSFIGSLIQAGASAVVSAALNGNFIASMIVTGAMAVANGAKVVASFVASLVLSGVTSIQSAASMLGTYVPALLIVGAMAVVNGAKIVGSFVASLITTSAQAIATGAVITAQFVASLIKAAAQAVVTGATFLASLVPALISVIAEAVVAAVTAIPALVVGFAAWAVGAWAAAAATIAATWPVLAIIAALALLGGAIYLVVTHWSQITAFLQDKWQAFTAWFMDKWNGIVQFFKDLPGKALTWGRDFIQGFIDGINNMLGGIGNAAKKVADTISSWLHHTKPEIGPLAEDDKWGADFVENINQGILSGIPKLKSTMGLVAAPLNLSVSGGGAMQSGAAAISSNFAATVAASQPASSNGQQTIILEVDGHRFGHVLMPHIADQMRYTLGVQGS